MTLKLLQLNINSDNYWKRLIPFLTSADFDILHLQEVTGNHTVSGFLNSKIDVYKELKIILSLRYDSELAISQRYSSDPQSSYMGNATFYKKEFILQEKHVVVLYKDHKPFSSELNTFEDVGRTALHLKLVIDDKLVSFINTHLAWAKTPKEEPHQTKQGEIFLEYLNTVSSPFVLTGDFNLDPEQPTIQKLNNLARNLISENNVTNTLNPREHRAKNLFPKGVAVDYIYVSSDLKVENFEVVTEDISDHFGLIAEINI